MFLRNILQNPFDNPGSLALSEIWYFLKVESSFILQDYFCHSVTIIIFRSLRSYSEVRWSFSELYEVFFKESNLERHYRSCCSTAIQFASLEVAKPVNCGRSSLLKTHNSLRKVFSSSSKSNQVILIYSYTKTKSLHLAQRYQCT